MQPSDRPTLDLEPADSDRLARLCGPQDENLRVIENALDVRIHNRGHHFEFDGDADATEAAVASVSELYGQSEHREISPEKVHVVARSAANERALDTDAAHDAANETATGSDMEANADTDTSTGAISDPSGEDVAIKTRTGLIRGRGPNQRVYLARLRENDLSFGIGPAGTGKTFLAVAAAVDALESHRVQRLLLVRPAVEAGERLGFLPGDLTQKVDPYLRPLYDALYEMLGVERVGRLIEQNVIEIAPLAYMRGRTLNEAYIILDEAQNTTVEQMKMFLTRIGVGSTAVVTGDTTQVDLPANQRSGLSHAVKLLTGIDDISVTQFAARDVVRHPLVQKIVQAYERDTSDNEHRPQ